MEFCPKCGTILTPEKGKLICKKCGYKKKEDLIFKEKVKHKKVEKVTPKEFETLPKTKVVCPVCGNNEAYWWTAQTRAADEPETMFFRCTKCHHTWREYL